MRGPFWPEASSALSKPISFPHSQFASLTLLVEVNCLVSIRVPHFSRIMFLPRLIPSGPASLLMTAGSAFE